MAVSFAAALLAGASAAQADITVERVTKTGGFGGIGAGDMTSVEKYSGLRKRAVTTMKMSGFLAKVAGDVGGDEITDVAKDVVWKIDHKAKTYTESRITPPPSDAGAHEGRGREEKGKEKPTVRVVRNEVQVKQTGEKKNINGFDCEHYAITWLLETENLETKERSESTMVTDLWNTPESGDTRALAKAEREFTEAWLKKMGWDMSEQDAGKFGLAMVAGMIGGDEASLEKGAKDVAEKMRKVQGFPIATGVKWLLKSSGDQGGGGGSQEAAPEVAKAIGGLMAAIGKKSGKSSQGQGASSGPAPAFESYTEIRKISPFSIPDAEFAPPAGYKKAN